MSQYRKNQWKEFRKSIIELDGYKCRQCGRREPDVILQVHHLKYIHGRKPWEYAFEECKTLCSGCHAQEHGIKKPQFGWEYVGQDDLGDLIGTCENCKTAIRHVFYIQHPNWPTLEVGTYCCDKLTDSKIASNLMDSLRSYEDRKERFINSKRWKLLEGIFKIKQSAIPIEIEQRHNLFFIKVVELPGRFSYNSLVDAKERVFEIFDSGEIFEVLKSRNITIPEVKKKKVKNLLLHDEIKLPSNHPALIC